jgi:L-2-hydroxyglutarate oxidase LhgO
MEQTDISIIGAGVVGLAVAQAISKKYKNVLLIEKHSSFGQETSSRSSEVIHASIYYPKESLKGKLCLEGNEMMYDICKKNSIPHLNSGKLIVAVNDQEAGRLPALLETAKNNGAKGVRIISGEEVSQLEPNVFAKAAILCPTSGYVDSHRLMQYFEAAAINQGTTVVYNLEVIDIVKVNGSYKVRVLDKNFDSYTFNSKILINCAGLESGHISELAGIDIDKFNYRINYHKGIYFRAIHQLEKFPKMLIYPVPKVSGRVGIHTTPDMGGGMRLGPEFFYSDTVDYSVDETYHQYFYDFARRFLPFLKIEDLQPEGAGIMASVQKPGEPMADFVIRHEADKDLKGFINLVGIESPGLTASPAIGKYVNDIIMNMKL